MEELGISDHRQDYWFMELDGFMIRNDLCPPEGVLITELKVVRSHRIYEYDVHGFQVGSHEVLLPLLFRQLFLPLPLVQLQQQFHDRIAEVLCSFDVDPSHHHEIIEHILSFASTTAGMAMAGEERRVLRIFPLLHIFTSESVVVLGHDPDQEENELLLRSESEDEGVVNRRAPEHVVRELRELHGFQANKNQEDGRLGICPICLDNMVVDEDEEEEATQLIKMPCSESHVFHDQCIVMWLQTRNSCPLCRFAIG